MKRYANFTCAHCHAIVPGNEIISIKKEVNSGSSVTRLRGSSRRITNHYSNVKVNLCKECYIRENKKTTFTELTLLFLFILLILFLYLNKNSFKSTAIYEFKLSDDAGNQCAGVGHGVDKICIEGHFYKSIKNENGYVVSNGVNNIYFGKNCDASSILYGDGFWSYKEKIIKLNLGGRVFVLDNASFDENFLDKCK